MSTMTRRAVLALGAGAVVAGAVGYAVMAKGPEARPGFEHVFMTGDEIAASDALVVDIRTPPEWAQTGVIEGAELIEFDFDHPNTFLPKIAADLADGGDLILYCRSGNRSQVVGEFLAKQIPNRIISIEGGIKKVIANGYRPVRAN